ncbi:chemotaxis protein CheW [Desulfovibrio sp.]|uniref:chemotaxis protein CheW n=1 Tax=Desulfovibrio sp. TaxID=885 RepID=UPI0023BFC598|nr:chemotaxis protein CheW [Desulfovibrio sp.]MDE7240810.1 chemotaxis protein CheW [Desulfovibrio sp.]
MVKTPEEYFSALDLAPGGGPGLNEAERAFVEKYVGADMLAGLPALSPEGTKLAAQKQALAPTLRERLQGEARVQMVSFYVQDQLFLLPVAGIQEVLRHIELVKVPMAPSFVAGVINLRGRVTPLILLAGLLTLTGGEYTERSSIIVCGADMLQLGLIVDRVHTMHMVEQEKILWNVESKLGESADFLCGVVDLDDHVCGIVAPEMITQRLLAS